MSQTQGSGEPKPYALSYDENWRYFVSAPLMNQVHKDVASRRQCLIYLTDWEYAEYQAVTEAFDRWQARLSEADA